MNKSSLFDQISEEKVKCKWIFTLIAVLCFSLISTERCLAIAYAITSDDGTTVTFFNDSYFYNKWSSASVTTKKPRILIDDPSYNSIGPQYTSLAFGSSMNGAYWRYEKVTKVVFDASFDSFTSLKSCENWFYEFKNLTTIEGLQYFHPDNVTDISAMFGYCEALTEEQLTTILSMFVFSKITDMGDLFVGCTFESFDFSKITNINTANVTDMSLMFTNCLKLKSVNLTSLDTRSVTDMRMMFSGCESLEQINVGTLNTANVEDMSSMFNGCKKLTSIMGMNAVGFNTSKVTKMGSMFSGCNILTSVDASGLETNNVTDMSRMFKDCSALTTLNLSTFVTNTVEDFYGLFEGCSSLTNLDISNFNTSNMNSSSGLMFKNCNSIEEIDLSSFSKFNGYETFSGCSSLKTIKLPDNGVVIGNNICGMFQNCSSIEYIDFSDFKITDDRDDIQMFYTFQNCTNLVSVDLTSFDGAEVTVIPNLFDGCSKLASVLVPNNWILPSKYNNYNYSYNDPVSGQYVSLPYSEVSVFDGCTEIIGDKGTRYSSAHIKYDYADIDGGESAPAYFTTGKYKVFYVNTEEATFATNNPIEFDKNLSSDITIVNPEKKGYAFLGWTGTSASGISETVPTQNVTISKGSVGNRIYTANWKINQYTITFDTDGGSKVAAITQDYNSAITAPADPTRKGFTFLGWQPALPTTMPAEDITVKAQWRDDRILITANLNGEVSFPANAENYCSGSEKTVTIDFKITQGESSKFELTFPGDVIPSVSGDITNGQGSIVITIPDNIESGVYTGKLVFESADPDLYREMESPVTITANIPKNAALQIYSDVLLVDNHDNNYSAYQWYKDGNAISGATLQFYSEPSFSGRYTVKITDKDGKEFMSCPIKTGVSVKNTKSSVKVYPNPATSGEQFTLEIEEYDPAKDYTIMIFTANGTLVKKLTGLEKINTTTLPMGIYSGSLISNGEKSGFKVIVK